jgi:RNA polymerase sigma-70 factor, ECF subfamily
MNTPRNRSDNQDDAILIDRVLAGEREAFAPLLTRYQASVMRLCIRLLGSVQEAQDVAQEAAFQAFLGLACLREPARFGAWFHAIAANLARLELRRRRDPPLRPLEGDTVRQLWWTRSDPSFEEMAVARDIHDSIMTALQALSEVNRQAVIGFYLQGYTYAELAQLFQVPVSTVKGRLFEGRRHLRATLQPIAEATLQPPFKHVKEPSMHPSELVALELDAIGEVLPLTRQPLVVLREAQTQRSLVIRLTPTSAETLLAAVRSRQQQPNSLPSPPDLTQQLVESLGAKLRQVVIYAVGSGIFYATLTVEQGEHISHLETRLSEALALAVRMSIPILTTRALLDAATSRGPFMEARTGGPQSARGLASAPTLSGTQESSTMGREANPRLLQPFFFERVWAFLLEELTGTRAPIELAQLQTLDLSTRLPTREVTWEEQPMIAIHLPEPQETAWLLVRSQVWAQITTWVQRFPYTTKPTPSPGEHSPDELKGSIQQAVETSLARLQADLAARTALLIDPRGTPVAWKGLDSSEEIMYLSQEFASMLAWRREMTRQLGEPPLRFHQMRNEGSTLPGMVQRTKRVSGDWWLMLVYPVARSQEEVEARMQQAVQELEDVLSRM